MTISTIIDSPVKQLIKRFPDLAKIVLDRFCLNEESLKIFYLFYVYQSFTTLSLDPVSIRPPKTKEATLLYVNWPVVNPKSSYKTIYPVLAAPPNKSSMDLRCNS